MMHLVAKSETRNPNFHIGKSSLFQTNYWRRNENEATNGSGARFRREAVVNLFTLLVGLPSCSARNANKYTLRPARIIWRFVCLLAFRTFFMNSGAVV